MCVAAQQAHEFIMQLLQKQAHWWDIAGSGVQRWCSCVGHFHVHVAVMQQARSAAAALRGLPLAAARASRSENQSWRSAHGLDVVKRAHMPWKSVTVPAFSASGFQDASRHPSVLAS